MKDKRVVNVVGVECSTEVEEKFDKWHEEVHIPLLLKFPGLLAVTRYRMTESRSGAVVEADYPKYLAIYEFKNEEAFKEYNNSKAYLEARAEMLDTWGGDPHVGKPGGFSVKWRVQYEVLKTWSK
jgi:heme-degrading monooxygenase HmoA